MASGVVRPARRSRPPSRSAPPPPRRPEVAWIARRGRESRTALDQPLDHVDPAAGGAARSTQARSRASWLRSVDEACEGRSGKVRARGAETAAPMRLQRPPGRTAPLQKRGRVGARPQARGRWPAGRAGGGQRPYGPLGSDADIQAGELAPPLDGPASALPAHPRVSASAAASARTGGGPERSLATVAADPLRPSSIDRSAPRRALARAPSAGRRRRCECLAVRSLDRWASPRRIRRSQAEAQRDDEPEQHAPAHPAPAGTTYHPRMVRGSPGAALPSKAELHLHLDGSRAPRDRRRACRARSGSPSRSRRRGAGWSAPPRCRDQAELLTFFDLPIALLQTRQALRRATAELVESLADDGLTYAEVRWAPRLHLERGLWGAGGHRAVVAGIDEAAADSGLDPVHRAHRHRHAVAPARRERLAGAGCCSRLRSAGGRLRPRWAGGRVARAAPRGSLRGRRRTAACVHRPCRRGAGPRPDSRGAGARGARIAHGVTAASGTGAGGPLRERDVTLDLCPTSNVQAGIVADLAPTRWAGSIGGCERDLSTDDRIVSATTLTDETGPHRPVAADSPRRAGGDCGQWVSACLRARVVDGCSPTQLTRDGRGGGS